MASGSQNMTTYNARTVTGSSSAASPAGALLLSGAGRASDATGDTWIFLDSLGGTSVPWGIKHDQANNKIHIYGNNTDSVWTRMDTGDTYILGKVGIGYDPETSENSYKLYVNGGSYFTDTITGDATSAWHILGGRPANTTNFNTHFETASNLHHDNPTRTDAELTYNRFYLSHSDQTTYGPSALHLPVVDQHVLSFGIDNGIAHSRHIAFDIRTNAVYVRARISDTWGNWEQLVRNTGTWGISITGNATTATTASYANAINNDGGRRVSSEYMHADGRIRFYLATSSMTTGKPPCDGFIMKGGWDNVGGWDSMFAWGNDGHGYIRGSTGSGNSTNHTQAWRAWNTLLDSNNYTSYTVTKTGGGASGTWSINITGSAGSVAWANTGHPSTFPPSAHTHTWLELAPGNKAASTGAAQSDDTGPFTVRWYSQTGRIAQQPTQYGFLITCAAGKGSAEQHALWLEQCDGHIYHRGTNGGNNTAPPAFKKLWQSGDAVTNAVWNDLGESRKSITREPGYAIAPSGSRTSVRLEPGARIISDTWGFLLGDENDTEKAPVAISGRVLAYPLHDKSYYEVGDAVCAAEGGKIDKMTRDEIKEYPDRIIGIVNEIPDYDIWEPSREGGGREPIHTNGRIWIDVR